MEHIDYLESGLNELSRTLTPPDYPAPKPPSSAPKKQAPKPPSRKGNATHRLLEWDYTVGLGMAVYLEVSTLKVDVMIDLDKTALEELLSDEDGQGYTIQVLADAAVSKLEEYRAAIQETIARIDKDIAVLVEEARADDILFEDALLKMEAAMAKVTEADDTIAHYCREGAHVAQAAVAKAYKDMQDRSSKLMWFKIKIGIKLTVYAISASLSIAASILTVGTLSVLTVCSLAKLTADVTKAIIDCATNASTVEAQLRGDMRTMADKITSESTGSSVEVFFREAISAGLPFATEFMSSLGGAEDKLEKLYAKLSQLEARCNLNSRKINELLDKITEAESDPKVAALDDKVEKLKQLGLLRDEVTRLLTETSNMGRYTTDTIQYADACQLQLGEWRGGTQNSSTFPTSDTSYKLQYAAALGLAVNTVATIVTALV